MADFYDPWLKAHRPEVNELVRYIGYGSPMLARVLEIDAQRDRVLLALGHGLRRWDYMSQVRAYVVRPRRRRIKLNPQTRGRKKRS